MATADEARRHAWPSLVGARPRFNRWSALALPAVVFLVVVFLIPLLAMTLRSVTDPPGAGLANYEQFFAQDAYVRVLTNTFWIALLGKESRRQPIRKALKCWAGSIYRSTT